MESIRKRSLQQHWVLVQVGISNAVAKNRHIVHKREFDRSKMPLTPTPLPSGEGLEKPDFPLLLPRPQGEGGRGEGIELTLHKAFGMAISYGKAVRPR